MPLVLFLNLCSGTSISLKQFSPPLFHQAFTASVAFSLFQVQFWLVNFVADILWKLLSYNWSAQLFLQVWFLLQYFIRLTKSLLIIPVFPCWFNTFFHSSILFKMFMLSFLLVGSNFFFINTFCFDWLRNRICLDRLTALESSSGTMSAQTARSAKIKILWS